MGQQSTAAKGNTDNCKKRNYWQSAVYPKQSKKNEGTSSSLWKPTQEGDRLSKWKSCIIGSLTAHYAHWYTGQQRTSIAVCPQPALDGAPAVAQAPHLCFNSVLPCTLGLPGLCKILQLSWKYSKTNSAKLKKNLSTLLGFVEAKNFRYLNN